jgi:hypothetical protein
MKIAIDTPVEKNVSNSFRVSGWFFDEAGLPAERITILVNGTAVSSGTRDLRPDVAKAFASVDRAISAGFFGDVILENAPDRISLALRFKCKGGKTITKEIGEFHVVGTHQKKMGAKKELEN